MGEAGILRWFLRTLDCQWTYRLRRQSNGLCGVSTHMSLPSCLTFGSPICERTGPGGLSLNNRTQDIHAQDSNSKTWASLHMRAYSIRDLDIRHTQTGGLKHRRPHVL
ncbi:hypothetical protein LB505_000415 [Fusarium chuoi]|nr:hypothetical protein LB505_000415 [Fusarium chuoi]